MKPQCDLLSSNQVVGGSSPSGRARNQRLTSQQPIRPLFESPISHQPASRVYSDRRSSDSARTVGSRPYSRSSYRGLGRVYIRSRPAGRAERASKPRRSEIDPLLPLKQSIRDVRFWESLATRHTVIRDLTAAGTLRPKTAESCEKRNRYSGSPASPSAPMYSSFLSGCFWGEASARCLAYSAKLNVGSSSRTSLT